MHSENEDKRIVTITLHVCDKSLFSIKLLIPYDSCQFTCYGKKRFTATVTVLYRLKQELSDYVHKLSQQW